MSGLLALVWNRVSFASHGYRKCLIMWKYIFSMSFIQPSNLIGKWCRSTTSEHYLCTGNDKKLVCQLYPVMNTSTEFWHYRSQKTWFWQKLKMPKFNFFFFITYHCTSCMSNRSSLLRLISRPATVFGTVSYIKR